MIIFHDIIDLLHLQIGMVIYPSSRLESQKMTIISPCHTTASEIRQSLVACGEFPYRKFPCRRVSWDNPSINRGIFSLPCAMSRGYLIYLHHAVQINGLSQRASGSVPAQRRNSRLETRPGGWSWEEIRSMGGVMDSRCF